MHVRCVWPLSVSIETAVGSARAEVLYRVRSKRKRKGKAKSVRFGVPVLRPFPGFPAGEWGGPCPWRWPGLTFPCMIQLYEAHHGSCATADGHTPQAYGRRRHLPEAEGSTRRKRPLSEDVSLRQLRADV